MSIISSWSPIHGVGTTLDTSVITTMLSLLNERSVLVIDSQFHYGRLQDMMCPNAEDGISRIFTYAHTNNLTPENFQLYTTDIIEKKLYILGATQQEMVIKNLYDSIENILKCADASYDMVFVDTNAGVHNRITSKVLEQSEAVIVNMPQDDYVWDKYFAKDPSYWTSHLEGKKLIYVVSCYKEEFSHYNLRRIQHKYKLKDLYCIPENRFINKAVTDGRLVDFIFSNFDSQKGSRYFKFFEEGNRIIQSMLGLPKKRGMFFQMFNKATQKDGALNGKV